MTAIAPSDSLFRAVKKDARKFFKTARSSHAWDHTERVLRLSLCIGAKEGADLGVLKIAAVLHDIGRAEEDGSHGRVCHSEAGAKLARTLLERRGLAAETITRVVHCIQTHRYRKSAVPETLEAKILFDADKLDSIGAVGVGRAFLFAGEVGARLHNKGTDLARTEPYTKDDTAYREFMVKLRHIREKMHTKEGRRIAEERHKFMVAFFDRLDKETHGRL